MRWSATGSELTKRAWARALCRSEIEPAVRDVLDRHPDGLKAIAIRRESNRHPAFEFNIPTEYLHSWLSEPVKEDVIVSGQPGNRYRLAEYADNLAV